ncbi:hypothetical protein LAZ67_19002533 [Cordylochernes scorpioides]|uniref:Solute carrier family 10 member 6 n=1 Tax=Cordylochernes scorpioides TaxID=51811 RepID=A0ABY6LL61_9ARAC|nr:hypothetical protein LAZ67_19002533 [Cordylochernes scorpioides]
MEDSMETPRFYQSCDGRNFTNVWHHVRRPWSVLIGMLSQFVLLPLSAFCLISGLGLSPLHGTGMLLLSCSPGGVTSNIFAYFCDGDISLSITMTACSTVVALGMMPFNLWLYGRGVAGSVVIPYDRMAVSLVSVTAPVLAGMAVHWRFPKAALHLTKIGTYAGLLIIIVCQTMEFFIFPDIFSAVPWQVYVAVVALPLCGLTLGYGAALACRREPAVCRTVAIESGIQNVGTALTVASLSFTFQVLRLSIFVPDIP